MHYDSREDWAKVLSYPRGIPFYSLKKDYPGIFELLNVKCTKGYSIQDTQQTRLSRLQIHTIQGVDSMVAIHANEARVSQVKEKNFSFYIPVQIYWSSSKNSWQLDGLGMQWMNWWKNKPVQ